jgi:hypothetical protein
MESKQRQNRVANLLKTADLRVLTQIGVGRTSQQKTYKAKG